MSIDILPFYFDPWRAEHEEAARAIWDWHLALRELAVGPRGQLTDFSLEANKLFAGQSTDVLGTVLWQRVQTVIREFGLSLDEFAMQLESAGRLAGPVRFADVNEQREFFDGWICPVGRLLGSLASVSGILHVGYVNALSNGFYLLGRILDLPEDVAAGRIFIPQSELEAFSVHESQLLNGPPDDQVKKLLWKQGVRIRDYFARAVPLSRDLPRRYSVGFRRWWLGGLEMVNAIESRDFDVWTAPIRLSTFHRAQARFQARFARVSFRSK